MPESQQSAEPKILNIEILVENVPSPVQNGVSEQESKDTSEIKETAKSDSDFNAQDNDNMPAEDSDRKINSVLPPVVTNNVDDNQSNENNKTNSDHSVEGSDSNTIKKEKTKSPLELSSKEIDEIRPTLTTVVSTELTNHKNTDDVSTELVLTDCQTTQVLDVSCDGHNTTDNDNSNHPLPNAVDIQKNVENTADSLEMKSEEINISAHGSEPTTMNTPSSAAQNISVDSCNINKSSQISSKNNLISNISLAGEAIENRQIKIRKETKNPPPISTIYILKLLGFQTRVNREKAIRSLTAQVKQRGLPELVFSPEEEKKAAECTVISTSNWPTWISPRNMRFVLNLLTDTRLYTTKYFIETLTYKDTRKMGAALIHFTTPEVCLHIFKQLRAITLFNKNVQVELDLESKTRNTLMGKYIYDSDDDVLSTENKWLDLTTYNEMYVEDRNRQSVTLTEAPLNYRADLVPSYPPRLQGLDSQQTAEITVILSILGLPFASLTKSRNAIWSRTAHLVNTLPEPPLSKTCSSIYINNAPTWFEDLHFLYLLEVLTDNKWNNKLYYLDILQYSNGVNRGAALLRLPNNAICLDVYQQLRRISFLKGKKQSINISLDLAGEVENQITDGAPKVPWPTPTFHSVFRSRYVVTSKEMPPTYTLDQPPLVPPPNASQTQTKDSCQQRDETSNKPPESQSHQSDSHSSSDNPPATNVKTECQIKIENTAEDIDLKQIIDEQLKDIDFNGMVEENSNTPDNDTSQSENIAMSSAGTSSRAQERKEKIIHFKFMPPFHNIPHTFFKYLLCSMTENKINEKYYVVRFLRSARNKLLNECLIKFETPEDASMIAQSLDGKTFKHYSLEAKLIKDSQLPSSSFVHISNPLKRSLDCGTEDMEDLSYKRAKFDDEWVMQCGIRKFLPGTGRTEEKFGMNPNVLTSLGVKRYLASAVTVNNVNDDVTENKLRDVFSLAGKVYSIQMNYGKRPGQAKVDYYHPVEALQAISMLHGQKLYNSALRVTLCSEPCPKALPIGLEGVGPGFGNDGQPIADIPTYLETRKIYDVFHRMGQFAKNSYNDKDHPFLSYYTNRNSTSVVQQSRNPTVNVGTAIEAFGTVLVALNLLPPGTDHTNLTEIIKGLQKNDKVQKHMKDKNLQQGQGPNRNHQVEKFFELFSGLIEQYTKSQTTANLQSLLEMIVAKSSQSPSVVHTPNMHPNIQNVPLGMPNTNPNMKSAPGGMPNMQSATSGMPIMSTNMQSAPGGMPNMIPNMQSATNAIPVISTNMQSAPSGLPKMIPNMQRATTGMPIVSTKMQSAHSGMPNMNPNNQNHPYRGFGHTLNMNPKKTNPRNFNIMTAHFNPNKIVPEAPPPPRWGDPRFQDILANNVTQQDPAVNQGVPQWSSDATPPNRRPPNPPNLSNTQHMWSHPSQPHYDPRDDSGEDRDDEIDSSDYFESDLLQFKNLPSSVTVPALTRKMQEIGEIIFVEMTNNGRALIRFKRAIDAERCIRLFHQSKVDGHIIDVSPV